MKPHERDDDPENTGTTPEQSPDRRHTPDALAVRSLRFCDVDECDELHHARGLCVGHYRRWWRHGDDADLVSELHRPLWIDPRIFGTSDELWEYEVETMGLTAARAARAEAREQTQRIIAWRILRGLPPLPCDPFSLPPLRDVLGTW